MTASTHSIQPDPVEHGKDKEPLNWICTSRSFLVVEMSIDGPIGGYVMVILWPVLWVLNSGLLSRVDRLRLYAGEMNRVVIENSM